jgi:hypothetical protein
MRGEGWFPPGRARPLLGRARPRQALARRPQLAISTGSSAAPRMWLVAPPKIIWRSRLWV